MTFHVGQNVVCVSHGDLDLHHPYPWPQSIVVDGIYHVRAAGAYGPGFLWLMLEEYRASRDQNGREVPFSAEHFRPVVEKKTDISIFRKLLIPNPQRHELVSSVNGEDIRIR